MATAAKKPCLPGTSLLRKGGKNLVLFRITTPKMEVWPQQGSLGGERPRGCAPSGAPDLVSGPSLRYLAGCPVGQGVDVSDVTPEAHGESQSWADLGI